MRRALQAFTTPAPTTEGARGFRRRGAHAHRSPGDGARQKRAAERSKCVGPLLGGLGPCCFQENQGNLGLGSFRHRSGRRARSCSTSPLSLFLVARPREKNRKKKAAQSLARGSADGAAEGTASPKKSSGHIARCGSPQGERVTDSGNSRAWCIWVKSRTAVRKDGRDVRRRYGSSGRARASDSVADIDDGRLLLFSSGETPRRTKREFVTPTKSGAQDARAGANACSGNFGRPLGSETERGTRSEAAVSKRQLVLSRARWQSRERERGSVARAPIGGTRFGPRFSRLLSRKLEETGLGRSPHNPTATRRTWSRHRERGDETRDAKRPSLWEPTILTGKKRTSRGSDRRRRENASIFSAPNSVARRSTREPRKRRARVQLVR